MLKNIDPVRFQRVQEFSSEENYEFWGVQNVTCSVSSDGTPAWGMDSVFPCEPRNCSTEPLKNYISVTLEIPTTNDTIIIDITTWDEEDPATSENPSSVPIGTKLVYFFDIDDMRIGLHTECGSWLYTAEFLDLKCMHYFLSS